MKSRKIQADECQIMAYRSPRGVGPQPLATAMQRLWNPVASRLGVRGRFMLQQTLLRQLRRR